MLLSRRSLDRIRTGEVSLVFRRWSAPRARAGGRQRTAVGELAIDDVTRVHPRELTAEDAAGAGFASLPELLAQVGEDGEPPLWRIQLHWAAEDPRIALRQRSALDAGELDSVRARLERLDRASSHGPWTQTTLELIEGQPEVLAAELAVSLGREKLAFKRDVRKLKELGLTESLQRGYRLSPRGRVVLDSLRRKRAAGG